MFFFGGGPWGLNHKFFLGGNTLFILFVVLLFCIFMLFPLFVRELKRVGLEEVGFGVS